MRDPIKLHPYDAFKLLTSPADAMFLAAAAQQTAPSKMYVLCGIQFTITTTVAPFNEPDANGNL